MMLFGTVKHVHTERQLDAPRLATGEKIGTLLVDGNLDDIPDFVTFYFRDEKITMMNTAIGRLVRCHKCHKRDHRVKYV